MICLLVKITHATNRT